jgi:septal ring-binding cell division protein DamX
LNFFLLILGIFLIGTVASLLRRRAVKSPSRSGRYRSPYGASSLNLERPAPARSRRSPSRSAALAGPIFLGLVLVVMTFWLVAAFFLPEGEQPSMVAETQADAAYPEQALSLAGRLSPGGPPVRDEPGGVIVKDESGGVMAQAAQSTMFVSPAAPAPGLTAAAQAMVTADSSRFGQVGLLPAQTSARPAPPPAPPALPARPAPAAVPANPLPARAASSLPQAAAQTRPPLATSRPKPAGDTLLNASREFTVHLASFNDRENAEKYKDQLTASGEQAFISEVVMDGRRWHRVMSGRFATRDEAEAYGRDLKRRSLTAATGSYLIKPVE